VLITIGSVTGVSIAALFTGGLLPGVVLAITLSALVWWRYRGEDLKSCQASQGRRDRKDVRDRPACAGAAVRDPRRRGRGIATATEVSTIGIVYAFVVGLLVYRHFDWRRLIPMLVGTASLSGAILLIIGTATGMAWGLT
jgi:TRAP-type C4-dicarboxylate transport system permease large subunit